jgi:hypothetical protein
MCRQRSIQIGRRRHSPLRGAQSPAIGDTPIDGFFPGTRVPTRQRVRLGIESRKFPFSKVDSRRSAHDCPPSGYFNHPRLRGRNNMPRISAPVRGTVCALGHNRCAAQCAPTTVGRRRPTVTDSSRPKPITDANWKWTFAANTSDVKQSLRSDKVCFGNRTHRCAKFIQDRW